MQICRAVILLHPLSKFVAGALGIRRESTHQHALRPNCAAAGLKSDFRNVPSLESVPRQLLFVAAINALVRRG
jgi:hypothetical protein